MMPETVRCAKVISVGLLVGSVTAGIGTLLLASTAFGAAGGGDGGAPPVCTCGREPRDLDCGVTFNDSCGVPVCSATKKCPPPPPPPPPPTCNPGPCVYDSSPLACGETRYGWNGCSSCGSPQSGPSRGTCSVSTASCTLSTCGQTLTGTDNCGSCSVTCGPCATAPYSFAIPGDPQYGFSYPRPETKDLVGLAAKGNIIIGDYTSRAFEQDVLKFLRPAGGDDRKTKPYVVDETDRPMGYDNAFSSEVCKPSDSYKGKTSPCFDGNYDQQDKENGVAAYKLNPDGTIARDDQGNTIPRKFYESSLTDEAFRTILDTNGNGRVDQGDDPIFNATTGGVAKIEAVLFTNHALAGQVFADTLQIDGAMIARDDGLSFGNKLLLNHDMRLADTAGAANQEVVLPFSLSRPRLKKVTECPASGCP